jgi:peptide/nickel transport system substrate-binding protein
MKDDNSSGRGAATLARELPKRAQTARRKSQNAAVGSLAGWFGPSEACPYGANRRIISLQKPAYGECRVPRSHGPSEVKSSQVWVNLSLMSRLGARVGLALQLERAFYFAETGTNLLRALWGMSIMIRFETSIAALVIGVTISLGGPAAAENVLRWASAGGALTFEPQAYDDVATSAHIRSVYDRLVELDSDLSLVPGLAVAWRIVDATTWEFDLRPNVRFHDGTPFTAADAVFSIERAKQTNRPAGFAWYVENVVDVQPFSQHRVRIKTSTPESALPIELFNVEIMSKRWADAHDLSVPAGVTAGEENYASRHANGTGPFMLEAFEPNGPVVMVRNPDWWGFELYPHNIDRIEFTPIADPEERLAALLRGDLELLTDPPFVALDRIESTPGLKLGQATEPRIIYLGLDQSRTELRSSDVKGRNPFSDKRVRRAIYQAIDIEAIRSEIMRGLAIPAGMMVSPGVNGYTPELDQRPPHDPEAAKNLLAAAGYPDGFSVTLDCPNNRYVNDEAICRAIAAQLSKIGVDVKANAQPKHLFFALLDKRATDFYLAGWGIGTLDSYDVLRSHYLSQSGENVPGYSNARVDELIKTIGKTTNTYARDAMIEEIWKLVLDDIVYIPLHYPVTVWAMRDNLDLPVYPFNRPIFREARFK